MAGRISWFFILSFIGANLLLTFAEDLADRKTCGGTCIRVKSGNFSIYRCGKNKKKAFVIGLDFIKQLNKTGGEVGKTLYSLTKQNFSFSKQISKIKYQGLDVMRLELEATHKDLGAKIHIAAFMACQAGNITFGDEAYSAQNGSLKLIFTLENYPFCKGNKTLLCKEGEVGDHLDFGLIVRSRRGKGPIKNKDGDNKMRRICRNITRCSKSFNFGDDGDDDEMAAASQCENDGKFVNMSGDFPKAMRVRNIQFLVFRVPKFANRTRFDPGITIGPSEVEDQPGIPTKPSKATSIHLSVLMVVFMATSLFTFM